MKQNYITISISINDIGKRIDSFLAEKIQYLSRNRLKTLICNGNLKFNDQEINQPSIKLKKTGLLVLLIPQPEKYNVIPQKINLNIIYEDKNLIVIDKAAGIVVHPGSGNRDKTLVNALLAHCKNNLSGIGGVLRPGVVHRIDKMTSGLLVFAKDDITHNSLSKQFKQKTTKRIYDLLTWNLLPKSSDKIETYIGRSKFNRQKMVVSNSLKGKKAITNYNRIKSFFISDNLKISYVKCQLLTGRTHQIRVHMSHIGNPIIGDKKYSRNSNYHKLPDDLKKLISENFIKTERHALHAGFLGFYHPIKKTELTFESKLPNDFSLLLKSLNALE